MVRHFHGKASTSKIELKQERVLRFLLNHQKSTYLELLKKCNYIPMIIRLIEAIAMDVLKLLHDLNPHFMKKMFIIKELKYGLRDSNIIY